MIRFMADRQEVEFDRLGLEFRTLWGRRLQLIDCQNLFCEVDKYARVAHPEIGGASGRTRIKQKFRPHPDPIDYWYPPKWGINEAVAASPDAGPAARPRCSRPRREETMDFRTYQERASEDRPQPRTDEKAMMIPLLGLAGEAGELLGEYKKYLRDGESHKLFKERFAEEVGDLLWYLANVATKFGLDLARGGRAEPGQVRGAVGDAAGPRAVRRGVPRWASGSPGGSLIDFATPRRGRTRRRCG